MKAKLLSLLVCLLMLGCGEPDLSDPDVVKDATADAVDWSKLQDRSGVTYLPNTDKSFSGYAKRTYENEQVEILAQLKDGYAVRVKQWQENGNPKWDIGFMEGEVGIEGMPYKGNIDRSQDYFHGPVKFWHMNGQKAEEGYYKDGKFDGLSTGWHENGQKKWETNWRDGKRDGLWTTWHENGQKSEEGHYKDGKFHGLWTTWHENGQKWEEGNWKEGDRDGPWTEWYENGQKEWEGSFKDGREEGLETRWYDNGQKKWEGNRKDGNKDGLFIYYREDGTEFNRRTWKDGKLVD